MLYLIWLVEVGDDVENVKDIVVGDDVVGDDREMVEDVVHLGVDDVVDKFDLEDVELYDVDVEQEVVDVECEVVVVEKTQNDEKVAVDDQEDACEVVDVE